MQSLVASVVGLPLLASGLAATIFRRRPLVARHVALATTALTVLCAAALAFYTSDASLTIPEWLPDAGPMGLTAGASGLYATLATTLVFFLILLSTPTPPLAYAILLLALAGASGALMADHFLLRYVTLEIAALCVLLAPLAEKPIPSVAPSARGGYLLLRLGDAGLLAAILILWRAAGTLHIDPALEAGEAMGPTRLSWTAAGLVLAVWVKLGCWPFHIWSQTGQQLSLASQAWLYATVVPNLGLYLLYRVTPILAYAGPVQTAALWIGAVGTLPAAFLALAQPESRAAMVHVGAAQGSLMLVVAAAGCKSAVWLGLLALTPLRLLLFLAIDTAQKANSTIPRRVAAILLAFGRLALLAFNLVVLWWARESIPTTALFIAQVAAALASVWTVQPRGDSVRAHKPETATSAPADSPTKSTSSLRKAQWAALALLIATIMIGGLAFGSLARFAADITHTTPPATPTLHTLTSSLPALLVAVAPTAVLWQLRRRSTSAPISQGARRETWNSEKGLARVAETLHSIIEVTILERALAWVKHAVTDIANIVWVVEHGVLEGVIDRSVQAVTRGADAAHRTIEQEGLEGILRRTVDGALALGRRMQRWHTGRLRRNLLWVPVALALAILALVVYGT